MSLTFSLRGRGLGKGYVMSLLQGLRSLGYNEHLNNPNADVLVYNGMVPDLDAERAVARAEGRKVIIIDLGYFRTCKGQQYYQLGQGKIGWVPPYQDSQRWESFGLDMKPIRLSEGGEVMIATQVPNDTQHRLGFMELAQWYTDKRQEAVDAGVDPRRVYLRTHPKAPMVHPPLFRMMRVVQGREEALSYALAKCRAVMVYNSTIFYEAMLEGVPVTCHPSAHYAALSAVSVGDDIILPSEDERLRFFEQMAYGQWTASELSNGEAVDFILNA